MAVKSSVQAVRQGQWRGRCRRSRRAGSGQPRRDVDELGADGGGGGLRVKARGQNAGGAGEVERDCGQHQPGLLVYRLLQQAVDTDPHPLKELIGG